MGKINLLPPSVAELIAAGEVIDRPASIVKELVENSLDAGANRISVEIRNGGITYLRVTDNGCGISREDLPTAFVRHATSKIATAKDLDAIMTLGFRGEALPSIAAVSRICVTTRTQQSALGTRYRLSGADQAVLEDAGCAVGTEFEVRDVFYNTPARMKFLKKDVTEGNAVAALLERLALANPQVSFELIRDGKRILQTPGDGNLRSVIRLVCGADVAGAMLPVSFLRDGIGVSGMISRPSVARSTRSLQTFFINSRYVRSRTCAGAVEEAYKNRLMTGRFPACVLNLTIDSSLVDVNVHPAKLEVRFSSEREVYNAVYSACLEALERAEHRNPASQKPLNPFSLSDFDYSGRQTSLLQGGRTGSAPVRPAAPGISPSCLGKEMLTLKDTTAAQEILAGGRVVPAAGGISYQQEFKVKPATRTISLDIERTDYPHDYKDNHYVKQNNITYKNGGNLKENLDNNSSSAASAEPTVEDLPPSAALSQDRPALEQPAEPAPDFAAPLSEPEPYRVIGEVFCTYLLVEQGDQLLLIDKHAAHERVIYNRIRHLGEAGQADRQLLLTPQPVTLPREEYAALLEHPQALEALGITAEDFGERTLLVREMPMALADLSPEELLTETAQRILACRTRLTPDAMDELLYSIACKAAVKAGSGLGRPEMEQIAAMVLGEEGVRYCPHGRPVILPLSRREIAKMFGRMG